MDAYERAVVHEAIEQIAAANEKLTQQIRELQELCKKIVEELSAEHSEATGA